MAFFWTLIALVPLALGQQLLTPLSSPVPTPMPTATGIDDKYWDCLHARQACESASLSLDACNSLALTRLPTTVSTNLLSMVSCLCRPTVETAFSNCMVVGNEQCFGNQGGNATMMTRLWGALSCSRYTTGTNASTSTLVGASARLELLTGAQP